MLLADGQSVVWASRLLGRPLPERVAGIDLFEALLDLADREGTLGLPARRSPEVLAGLEQRSSRAVAGRCASRAAATATSPTTRRRGRRRDRGSAPDMLFLGMTSPEEGDLPRHATATASACPCCTASAARSTCSPGVTARAPARLAAVRSGVGLPAAQEPRRLWRRYLVTNTAFLGCSGRAVHPHACLPARHGHGQSRPPPATRSTHMDEIFSGRVAVIGLGYIGLPTAVALATRGVDVVGVDVNAATVEAVERRRGSVRRARPRRRGQRRRRDGQAQGHHRDPGGRRLHHRGAHALQ